MIDTRAEVNRILGKLEFSSGRALAKVVACAVFAGAVALLPTHAGLSEGGRWAFFILLFGGGLWVTEAIPAFAVALVIIGLEIAILGRPSGVFAQSAKDWEMFVMPWSSPLIWLFFGGLVLGSAAARTGLDRWFSGHVLYRFGSRPVSLLLGTMGVTFAFSMFMSNTASTAMMLAVIGPVIATLKQGDPFAKALLLGIPFAANLGGMATIIGTPPNAIVAGFLADIQPVNFTLWMVAGLPPALTVVGLVWLYLIRRYPCTTGEIDLSVLQNEADTRSNMPLWKRYLVMILFFLTVGLWMTGPIHGIPTPVVSFLPICVFAATGVITAREIRTLQWDVLLLITGGLSLGVAVTETGLANWLVSLLPIDSFGKTTFIFILAYLTAIISNFMSNTAAANILVPMGMVIGLGFEAQIVIPIALGASAAMCLPISTPPNALAYATGKLATKDFLVGGLVVGLLVPAMAVIWCTIIFG